MLAAMAQMQRNVEFFLAHYLRGVTGYRPDIATFVIGSTQVVVAVGEASGGQVTYRSGVGLAERSGTEVVVFPGDHGGFSIHPDSFAAMLHKVLVAG